MNRRQEAAGGYAAVGVCGIISLCMGSSPRVPYHEVIVANFIIGVVTAFCFFAAYVCWKKEDND